MSQTSTILTASDAGANDYFGNSVSISNDGFTALIGAPLEDASGTNSGATYVFKRSNATWTQDAKLKASDVGDNDQFGSSVDITQDGNYGIIGPFCQILSGSSAPGNVKN